MASTYSELTYLEYTGAVDNSGNGVKAQFNFQGYSRGVLNLDAGRTWSVSMGNTDGPMCFIATNNQEVSGVTAKILTSATESGTTSGTLEMYPLTAGTTYTLQAYDEGGTPTVYTTFTPTLNNDPRIKNLASGTLAESVSASTTTLLVYVGEGSAATIRNVWPDTPFYATIMPATPSAGVANSLDSEIVKVTAVGNDQIGNTSLTVTRAQRGTTGKAFTAGAIVTNADYADDAVRLGEGGTTEAETPWIETEDITDDAITADKIDWSSMSDDNNNIRKIYTTTVSGTTDANGFFTVDASIIAPSNAIILGARGHGNYNGFYFPYSDTGQSRFTMRCLSWDFSAIGNSYRECDIAYIKVS